MGSDKTVSTIVTKIVRGLWISAACIASSLVAHRSNKEPAIEFHPFAIRSRFRSFWMCVIGGALTLASEGVIGFNCCLLSPSCSIRCFPDGWKIVIPSDRFYDSIVAQSGRAIFLIERQIRLGIGAVIKTVLSRILHRSLATSRSCVIRSG